jgi:hypothetical protein
MGEKMTGKLLYAIEANSYTGLIALDVAPQGAELNAYAKIKYMGEILLMRNCTCGNLCLCYMRVEGQGTYTATYDANENATCALVADTLVQCKCGRKYRTPSRRALSNIKLHEIVEKRWQENRN